jgi:hypothetical protein
MRLCEPLTTRIRNKYIYGCTTQWTELCFQDKVLCNDIFGAHFVICNRVDNPEQVINCEVCGEWGCAGDAKVQISKTGEYILWSPPVWIDEPLELANDGRLHLLTEWGSLLFPVSIWREKTRSDTTAYPATTRLDLMLSWLLEYYCLETINDQFELMAKIHQRLIRGNNLDRLTIHEHLQQLIVWFEADPEEPLRGKLVQANSTSARIEILYLDNPVQEWPAFVLVDGQVHPAFGYDWVYLDESCVNT